MAVMPAQGIEEQKNRVCLPQPQAGIGWLQANHHSHLRLFCSSLLCEDYVLVYILYRQLPLTSTLGIA